MQVSRERITIRRKLVVAMVVASCLPLAIFALYLDQHRRHLAWYRLIEGRIARLAGERPEDLSPNRWAYCLHWTWNLHCNCGTFDQFDEDETRRFLEEFDRRLAGRVDLGTIDWIWDEYAEHSRCGRWYSTNFRPTDPDHVRGWFIGQERDYRLQYWIDLNGRIGPSAQQHRRP
jgi:hypothetical protein